MAVTQLFAGPSTLLTVWSAVGQLVPWCAVRVNGVPEMAKNRTPIQRPVCVAVKLCPSRLDPVWERVLPLTRQAATCACAGMHASAHSAIARAAGARARVVEIRGARRRRRKAGKGMAG